MGRRTQICPWLDRRENEIYYVYWYDYRSRQTKRESLRTNDRKRAVKAYAEFLLDWNGTPQPKHLGATVASVLEFYLNHRVDKETLDTKRPRTAMRNLNAYFKSSLLREVDVPACVAYAEARRTGQVKAILRKHSTRIGADGTIRRELNVLGTAARFALKRRFIKPEDMPSLEVPAEPPGRIHYLTRDELKRVFKSATGSLRDFISIAYYTGARRAAVEGLRWDQVDLEHGHINLLPADASPLQRKSRKRRPIVPIDPQLRPTLERLRIRKNDRDFVLPPIVYSDAFRRHMTALGMPGKRYPHILRHTRATHLLQDGISIYNVARLLGDNPLTVERVYGHHSSEFLGAAIGYKSPSLG